jgi:hypothetical protein
MEYPNRGSNAVSSALEFLHNAVFAHDRASVLRLLRAALRESRAATDLTAMWHPTGFIVVQFPWEVTERSVRLHIWPTGDRIVEEPCWLIHDHVWSFRSHVLQGELVSREYVAVDACDSDQSLYEVEYLSGSVSWMTDTRRRVEVESASSATYGSGEFYNLPSRRFHAISVPRNVFSASLVATRRDSSGKPLVIGTTHGPARIKVDRKWLEPDAKRHLIEKVISAL